MKQEFKIISSLINENSKILDVGCGNGVLMKYILENISKNIRGLEISKKNVQECIEKGLTVICLLYTSPSPRDMSASRMPSSA